jgi:hypothetical protein
MDDSSKRFSQQALWQKNRRSLSWPEKVRQAEAMRETIIRLRASKPVPQPEPRS